MTYEGPKVIDYGSISDHTFSACNPGGSTGSKIGSPEQLVMDKFCECSHSVGVDLCGT